MRQVYRYGFLVATVFATLATMMRCILVILHICTVAYRESTLSKKSVWWIRDADKKDPLPPADLYSIFFPVM